MHPENFEHSHHFQKGLPPRPMSKPWDKVNPNSGHYAIVDLQKLGKLKFLIYQNVDNLHLKFHEAIGDVLPRAVKRLKRQMELFE